MSTGGKWVKTRVPSMPSHQKVWCGNRLVWFQEIFWVRNQRDPDSATELRQRRGVAERVRQPDLGVSTPNSSRKNRLPCTNCRASASPPGMLVSDSTHMPPTGTNCPFDPPAPVRRPPGGAP